MSKMLFSIIIPHYDIPDLLMRCLKSIPVSEGLKSIFICIHVNMDKSPVII